MQTNQNIETTVAILKKDVDNITNIFNKLELTFEKLSEVSNNVSRLLSMHEQRLDTLHEADKLLEGKLEENHSNFAEEIKELHQHIRTNNKEVMDRLKSSEESIKDEVKHVSENFDKDNQLIQNSISLTNESLRSTNRRIDAIERWKWLVIGGAVVVGWFINKLPISITY